VELKSVIESKNKKEVKFVDRIETLQSYYQITKKQKLQLKEEIRILRIRIDNDHSYYSEDEDGHIIKTQRVAKKFKKKTVKVIEDEV
jgi:hypothetical protein